MSALVLAERPADGVARGLLVLHHGRGADERDLLGLADALDPDHALHVAAPRGPLVLEGWPGFHWYTVPRVGFPAPETFFAARAMLARLHEELWERTGLQAHQTVLGGFSMGAVMSYALALSGDRPAPAGLLAFAGFIPTVAGWQPSLADRMQMRAFIAHGRADSVIDVDFARGAQELLRDGGLTVEYHESGVEHRIDPGVLASASRWLAATLPAAPDH